MVWRHGTAPARYLLPDSFKNAAAQAGNTDRGLTFGTGHLGVRFANHSGDPIWSEAGADMEQELVGAIKNGRLSPEYVSHIEDRLEAEYYPFYFHDLRTNEVIGLHAFITNLNENFNVQHESTSGYGRVDDVHIYKKTARSISLSFVVCATNPHDLDVMWFNINKLTAMCYPQWSPGRKVEGDLGGAVGVTEFTQPFSQIPTASPVIRLRLGDLLKSNYSRFGLGRLFGLGEIGSKPPTDISDKALNASQHLYDTMESIAEGSIFREILPGTPCVLLPGGYSTRAGTKKYVATLITGQRVTIQVTRPLAE